MRVLFAVFDSEATALLENGHQDSYHVYNKRLFAILQSKLKVHLGAALWTQSMFTRNVLIHRHMNTHSEPAALPGPHVVIQVGHPKIIEQLHISFCFVFYKYVSLITNDTRHVSFLSFCNSDAPACCFRLLLVLISEIVHRSHSCNQEIGYGLRLWAATPSH